jgi:hypothetical protein
VIVRVESGASEHELETQIRAISLAEGFSPIIGGSGR